MPLKQEQKIHVSKSVHVTGNVINSGIINKAGYNVLNYMKGVKNCLEEWIYRKTI